MAVTIRTCDDGVRDAKTEDGYKACWIIEDLEEGDPDYMWVEISDHKDAVRIPLELFLAIADDVNGYLTNPRRGDDR